MRITAAVRLSLPATMMPGAVAVAVPVAFTVGSGAARAGVQVRVIDGHYKVATVVKDSTFAGVNGAVIGSDGALYVVHSGDGTTTRIDLQTMAASEFVHPWAGTYITDDITADDKGNLYTTGTTP